MLNLPGDGKHLCIRTGCWISLSLHAKEVPEAGLGDAPSYQFRLLAMPKIPVYRAYETGMLAPKILLRGTDEEI